MALKTNQDLEKDKILTSNYYIECDDGWRSLVNKAIDIIKKYNDEHKSDEDFIPVEFTQIKEKRGILCLYLNYYPNELEDKIHNIEQESLTICEYCGSTKNVKSREIHGWIYTYCDDCIEKLIKNNKV